LAELAGKKTQQLNPHPLKLPVGEVESTYLKPKDSNAAVGVLDLATQKAPERYDRQTNRQTFRPLYTVSQKSIHNIFDCNLKNNYQILITLVRRFLTCKQSLQQSTKYWSAVAFKYSNIF